MGKITRADKTNKIPPSDITKQSTAEDWNEDKAAINVIYARLIDNNTISFYGDSDPLPAPIQDDLRFIKVGANLEMQRFEVDTWVQRAIFGSSVESDEFGITTTAGRVYYLNAGDRKFMLSPSEDGDGIIVGNVEGDTYLSSHDDFVLFEPDGVRDWVARQPLADETLIVNGLYEFNIAAVSDSNITGYRFISNTAGVKYRISVRTKAGILLDENISQYEFEKGNAPETVIGLNTTPLNGTYYALKDNLYVACVQTDIPMELQGHTFDIPGVTVGPEFYPKFDLDFLAFNQKSIIRYPKYLDGTTYTAYESKVWENRDTYICNVTGIQTGDFASNILKWDLLGSINEFVAKESISTSLISGGLITENTTTTIDVSSGEGRIISIDQPTGVATVTKVSWNAFTNVPLPDILTRASTRVGIDSAGGLIQVPFTLTPSFIRDYITLGFILHPSGTITDIDDDGLKTQELYSQFVDSLETNGVTRKKGLKLTANADLIFAKSAGTLQAPGAGLGSGNRGQNIVDIVAESPASFGRVLGITTTVETGATTFIDPGFYDDGTATKAAVPGINDASIQYVYQLTDDAAGGLIVMYGQTTYNNLSDAVINAPYDVVTIPEEIENRANLIARIALDKRCTDLTDIDRAVFLDGIKFGSGAGGLGIPAGGTGGGGDVFGGTSSTVDEISTNADTSGKVIKAASKISALAGVLKPLVLNADLKLKQNGNGNIVIEGDNSDAKLILKPIGTGLTPNISFIKEAIETVLLTAEDDPIKLLTAYFNGDGVLRVKSTGEATLAIESGTNINSNLAFINDGVTKGSTSYDEGNEAFVMQHGAGTGVPADKSVPFLAFFANQRFEIGTARFEQRTESELSNMQYLMVTNNINRGGFSYIATTNSFNVRVGTNPDNTGFDIRTGETIFRHNVHVNATDSIITVGDYAFAVEGDNGAVKYPDLATFERDALTGMVSGSYLYNRTTESTDEYVSGAWRRLSNPLGPQLFLTGITENIAGSGGTHQTIDWGTSQFYEEDGVTSIPPITNGVFTAVRSGIFRADFNTEHSITAGTGGCQVYISRNDAILTNGTEADTSSIAVLADGSGSCSWIGRITAGDTIRMKYISATGFDVNLSNIRMSIYYINN